MTQILVLVAEGIFLVAVCLVLSWFLNYGVDKRKKKIQSEVVKLKEDTLGALVKQHDAVSLLGEVNDILRAEYGYRKSEEFKKAGKKRGEKI